jgi:DNA-directed RNA polymerase specialized sigma24 family protein
VQRRSRAWRLVDVDGVSVQEAASRMKLPPGQVRRLVALHRDALELKSFKQDSIPWHACARSLRPNWPVSRA